MYKLVFTLALATLANTALASDVEGKRERNTGTALSEKSAISISIDNDLFVPAQSDKDYTAGFAITYQGPPSNTFTRFMDANLGSLDTQLFEAAAQLSHRVEVGSYGFTPEDIESGTLDRSDRPYASLVYLSSSRTYLASNSKDTWTSALTIGVLGLDVFQQGQDTVHDLLNGDDARGWDQQISEGGELTARYQLAYHQKLAASPDRPQLKASYFASLGYLSEVGVALSFRDGLISSPDHRFNPSLTTYGEQAQESDAGVEGYESYFWAGAGLKMRAYNSFLEGQFRRSEHSFDKGDLHVMIAEAWVGYSQSLFQGSKLSYVVRAQSSEIKKGTGDRHLVWGGFVLSKRLD